MTARSPRLVALISLAVVMILLPLVFSSAYYFRVAGLVWIAALAAVGLNILMGQAGPVRLGDARFFGLGAYSVPVAPAHVVWRSRGGIVAGPRMSGLVARVVGGRLLCVPCR